MNAWHSGVYLEKQEPFYTLRKMCFSYAALKLTALCSLTYMGNLEKNRVIFRTKEILLITQSSIAKNNNWVISLEALRENRYIPLALFNQGIIARLICLSSKS